WASEGVLLPPTAPAVDKDGNPTNDPNVVLAGGAPYPIGMHKGAGLSMLVEVLSGLLGSGFLHAGFQTPHADWVRTQYTETFIAIDIERFMPVDAFLERTSAYIT